MIRKPPGADRPSALRRTAEVALDAQQAVQRTGRAAGRGFGILILGWVTFAMFLGAMTAGSLGGTMIGLLVTGGFVYALRRTIKRGRAGA